MCKHTWRYNWRYWRKICTKCRLVVETKLDEWRQIPSGRSPQGGDTLNENN